MRIIWAFAMLFAYGVIRSAQVTLRVPCPCYYLLTLDLRSKCAFLRVSLDNTFSQSRGQRAAVAILTVLRTIWSYRRCDAVVTHTGSVGLCTLLISSKPRDLLELRRPISSFKPDPLANLQQFKPSSQNLNGIFSESIVEHFNCVLVGGSVPCVERSAKKSALLFLLW